MKIKPKQKILMIVALPPPYYGVSVANAILTGSPIIKNKYDVNLIHLKKGILQSGGGFSIRTVLNDLAIIFKTIRAIAINRPRLTYFCISQTRLGLWRETCLILLARLLGTKCLVQLRGGYFRNLFEEKLTAPEQQLVKLGLNSLSGVIVLDSSLAWIFQGLVPEDWIFVLHNGVPEVYTNADIVRAMRTRQTSPQIRVSFLSNFLEGKGFDTFLETAAELKNRGHEGEFIFYLAGASPSTEVSRQIEDFIASHRLDGMVRVVGTKLDRDKWRFLLYSDVFLFPTRYQFEGQPWAVIEALAAGLPVISTAQGCIPSMVQDGINGFIVPGNDPKGIADKLLWMKSHPKLRFAMGRASRNLYLDRYTGQKFVQGFVDIVDKILGTP